MLGSATGEGYFSPPGDLRAYDVVTGKLAWQFHTMPHPGEFGYETWPKDAWKYIGGANTWGEITIDAERGIAYFPTGSPTYDFYGADRVGANLFANCLIALDARTGKRLWHFQNITTISGTTTTTRRRSSRRSGSNGEMMDVVAHGGQDRIPLRVRSRHRRADLADRGAPVPTDRRAGRETWPTQPFPTEPPPFARQTFTVDDINPYMLTPPRAINSRSAWPRPATKACSRRSASTSDPHAGQPRRLELGQDCRRIRTTERST